MSKGKNDTNTELNKTSINCRYSDIKMVETESTNDEACDIESNNIKGKAKITTQCIAAFIGKL